jgi:excinuclease ABC subunit C
VIDIKSKIDVLPHKPGVYQYFNTENTIIYIGKAKDLKKRVSSYFVKNPDSAKTRILIRHIADIRHIVVETEEDALLLENNLIKKYQPRYNVLLKDDKTFPWIVIKNEPFPRVFYTRRLVKDGSSYFGPYTSMSIVSTLLDLFKQLYPIRTCNHFLSGKNIQEGKFKLCLEYHIGNCKGICEGKYTHEYYLEHINQIKDILKGNVSDVMKYLKKMMESLADNMEFEKAEEIKQKLDTLRTYQVKSTVVSPKMNDVDVFTIVSDDSFGYVNYLKVVSGAIVQSHTMEYKKKLDENDDELLQLAISEIKGRSGIIAKEILVPFEPSVVLSSNRFLVPKIGDKKKLLDLSQRNAKYYRLQKLKQQASTKKDKRDERILSTMQKDLRLSVQPKLIECFDNSNIQGAYPVAACVVFKNAKPAKREYRHFNVKTVIGANDFASMEEIVYRRYKRQLEEQNDLPQLIVIDGGKGQLGAASSALDKLNLSGKISIIGIAKKLEELYFPGDPVPLYLDKNSETLKIIQHLRNEAHRFGITFHRNKRSSDFIKSELDEINGIGEKTIQVLFRTFKSLNKIKEATLAQLQQEIGEAKGRVVYAYFNSTDDA